MGGLRGTTPPEAPVERVDRQVLQVLRRMMDGERLRVADAEGMLGLKKKAARSRLNAIVETLAHGRCSEPGPGHAAEFWWEWPKAQRVPRHVVLTLAAARTLLEPLAGTSIGASLDDLLQDAVARQDGAAASPGDVARMFYAHNLSSRACVDPAVVDVLTRAVHEQREVRYKYQSSRSVDLEETVHAWCLVVADEGLYLYGHCVDSSRQDRVQQCRLYNVARVSDVAETGDRFAYPARSAFDPAEVFGQSFGIFLPAEGAPPARLVILRFSADQRGFLEHHRLHPKQPDPVALADGRLEVRVVLHITYDLVRWIRGFGEEVEVVEPDALRTWVESRKGASLRKELGL